MMEDVAKIARGLTKADRECISGADPAKLSGSVGTLLALCLGPLANVQRDNTVYLTPLGVAVRKHLSEQGNATP